MRVSALCSFVACALALALAPPWLRADDTVGSFHRSFTIAGPVSLGVTAGSGAIRVFAVPGRDVTIDGTIRPGNGWFNHPDPQRIKQIENSPPIERHGADISIQALQSGWNENISISYAIGVPADTSLRAQTGSGAIEVSGITGGADLEAGSGQVRIATVAGGVRARSGSGGINFDKIAGQARLTARSGSIAGNEVTGRLTASTSSGHLSVHRMDQGGEIHTSSGGVDLDEVLGDLSARASSGSIHAGGELTAPHRWEVATSSGAIRLSLPEQTAAELSLATSSGGIAVDHPVRRQSSSGRHQWEGVIGAADVGTASLTAHTTSGSIRIE